MEIYFEISQDLPLPASQIFTNSFADQDQKQISNEGKNVSTLKKVDDFSYKAIRIKYSCVR